MANTPNYGLYKPNQLDTDKQVDITLSDNFTIIDSEIKNRQDEIENHENSTSAHDSANITHASSSVKQAILDVNSRIDGVDTTLSDRIDNLIASSGTSDTEVVDARGDHTVLRERLDDFDTKMALARTIEPKFDGFVSAPNINRWLQSICYIPKDNVVLVGYGVSGGPEGQGDIVKFNLSNYSIIQTYPNLDVFHCNDMTYNPNTDELIIATLTESSGSNRLAVYDYATMTYKRTVVIDGVTSLAGFAYDNDSYIGFTTQGLLFLDSSFTQTKIIPVTKYPNMTFQSMEVHDNLIYLYFDYLIWVFDKNGNRIREWYIPVHHEGEGITYIGNNEFLIGQISPFSYQENPRLLRFNQKSEANRANFMTVTSLSDIGIVEGTELIGQICENLSNKTKLVYNKESTNVSTAYPTSIGMLEVTKYDDSNIFLSFYAETGESWDAYYNKSNTTKFSGWMKRSNSTVMKLTTDANTIIEPGNYYLFGGSTNIPEAGISGFLRVEQYSPTVVRQTWIPSYQTGSHFYTRNLGGSTWNPWQGFFPHLNGSGSPESVVSGRIGALYIDTTAGKLYFKKTGTGSTGWQLVTS